MKKLKRQCYLYLFLIILASSNIRTFNLENGKETSNKTGDTISKLKSNQDFAPFTVGVSSGPHSLDPVDTWDTVSYNVIVQVCEGLFQYNLSDHAMLRVNHLAESYWWQDGTTLQIKLREGIYFHDMNPFNSTAAVWNINRILYFTNSSGTLPVTQTIAQPYSLYYFPDGVTPIINSVTAVGEYNITITLNGVYAPFLDLLCFTGSYMVSPYSTPADEYIDLSTGDLVGTGPFVYDGYTPNIEVDFHAFNNYWQGMANITEMVFSVISDSTARNNAMLSHDIDYLQGPLPLMIPTFETDPEITVMKFTETYGIPSLIYYYLGMNNKLINIYWRKAISYAINYTYIIQDLLNDLGVRANSPISPAYGAAYNSSVIAADYNLVTARQVLVDAGIAVGYPVNSNPFDAYWLANPLISLNYSYNLGNAFREDMYDALSNWLPAIGIIVIDAGMTFSEFIDKLFFQREKLGLFWIAWGPDFKDPYNILNPLFDPNLYSNSAQVDDAKLNAMMATALVTIDETVRNYIYKNIQSYLAERLYPHGFGYHSKIIEVHSSRLSNVPYNAFQTLYFYPCKWQAEEITPPPPPSPTFKVGVASSPYTIDPVDTWDSSSMDVIEQVCEGLFRYNLSDPYLSRINWLAEDYRWMDKVTLLIKLREGVIFHDGTPFDATAAKWNLDRLLYLTNCFGTLPPTTQEALPSELWKFPNGTAIINHVDVFNQTNILIHLNGAYGPLLDLLTITSAYMVSPSSTPANDYIDLTTGDLVGTGPFVYDGYIADIETRFHAFDNYWQGKANISEIVFSIIPASNDRNDAMLAGDIDFLQGHLSTYIPSFEADPEITVMHYTDTYGIPSLVYYFLGFNNSHINATWRKAMSYAINYTYIIEEMMDGEAIRANSPISPGFGNAYNASTHAANWNLAKARQVLIDAGIPGTAGLIANNDTIGSVADAWRAANLASFNYTYNFDNQFRSDLYIVLADWFDQIGITLIDDGVTWTEFLYRLFIFREKLQIYWLGFLPDYLDPYNMLYYLFDPTSISNSAQVNDTKLNIMLESALQETDDAIRDNIYKDIQGYLATQLYPHAFGYHPKITNVYSANLTKYPHNAFNRLYFYPCEWETREITPPPPPTAAIIFIDDSDPYYNWSKTALENDWCTGSGTFGDPYIIQDIEVDGVSIYNGIEIHNSNVYFKIENCTIHDCSEFGIYLLNTTNSIIYNNSVYNAMIGGVLIENGDNHIIYENHVWGIMSGFGIYAYMYSDHCEIRNNLVESCMGGIATVFGYDNLLYENTLINNYLGIGVGAAYNVTVELNTIHNSSMWGIILQGANETIVKENVLNNNGDFGILVIGFIYGSNDNTITYNQISDTTKVGIGIDELSSQNAVYLNAFVGNGINAQDNGTLNNWDNGEIGNSWDDYVGVDANDDGIGDSPYMIDGTAGSMDNYPIFDDGPDIDITPPIIIINEPDTGDEFGTTAPIYEIEIIESNLDSIWYTVDGGINNITITTLVGTIDDGVWNALPNGVVKITFFANDTEGNIGYASVLVYKNVQIIPPGIPGFSPILILGMLAIGIIGLIWQFKNKKFN